MKKLELKQMENHQGGLTNRDCMVRGAVAVALAFTPLFMISIMIAAVSSDCYTN
jgi:hypothetical protein